MLTLQRDYVVSLNGLALVAADGKKHVDTPARLVGVSAGSGALWGTLLGLLFLAPGIGLLLGGALGALSGKLGQKGIDDQFRQRVESMLSPGKAAVVVMASKITEDKLGAAALQPFGGTILQTSLSEEHERELASDLAGS